MINCNLGAQADNNFAVSCNKLKHDLDQVEYLGQKGLLPAARVADAKSRLGEFLGVLEPMIGCDEMEYRNLCATFPRDMLDTLGSFDTLPCLAFVIARCHAH